VANVTASAQTPNTQDARWALAKEYVDFCTPRFRHATQTPAKGPDVVCIGAQKAGTTWLYQNLAFHPRVYLPPIKEISYFSSLYIDGASADNREHRLKQAKDARAWWQASSRPEKERRDHLALLDGLISAEISDDWYRNVYAFCGVDQIGFDISPTYSILPRHGIRHLLHINPNVKIIILLRDPVERLLSHASMLKPSVRGASSLADIVASDAFFTLASYSDYGKWVLRWLGMMPRERILVEYLPNIAHRPMDVLNKVCQFAGIPFHRDFFGEAHKPVFRGEAQFDRLDDALAIARKRLAPLVDDFHVRLPEIADALWMASRPF
jgi:hypothetical protein